MPMKKKVSTKAVHPQIAKMNAARAAKRAAVVAPPKPVRRTTAQDEMPDYGNNYGDAEGPIERRRTGTQPNNRALSAVERAEARMAVRRGTPPQPPGMDVGYDADEALEDFYEGDADGEELEEYGDEELSLGPGEEVFPTEDELADAQERLSKTIAKRKGKTALPKGARMAPIGRSERQRGVSRQPLRRNAQGRVMVQMRDGHIISRTGNTSSDRFDVPLNLIPDGWSYQWIALAVNGKSMNNQSMFANGWEPVPAERHDGRFMAKGHDGPIIVDDQMLCERRIQLTLEARREEIDVAKNLLRTQNEQFKPRLPEARNRRGTSLRVRRTLERLPDDIGRPDLRPDLGDY